MIISFSSACIRSTKIQTLFNCFIFFFLQQQYDCVVCVCCKLTTLGLESREMIKAEVLNNSVSGSHLLEITQVRTLEFGANLSSGC